MIRGLGRSAVLAGGLAAATLLFLAACSPIRLIESASLLSDLAAPPPIDPPIDPSIDRQEVSYRIDGHQRIADLYRPATVKAGLVLVPGVTPQGRDDPRLVAFAGTLAGAGFAVLVPEVAGLRALRVAPEDVAVIADAIRQMSGIGESAPTPVGIVGISYAAGPALLAVLAPATQGRIAFAVTLGGYYDIEAVIAHFVTGASRDKPNAAWRHGAPNRRAVWEFVLANADRIDDSRDATTLAAMAIRRRADPDAPIDDLVAALGASGQRVHALLANDDPDRVPEHIAALPPRLRDAIYALDLKRHATIADFPAPILIVHGKDDPVIPFSESRALADAIGEQRAVLVRPRALAHVSLGLDSVPDIVRIWRGAYWLLAARDRMAAPSFSGFRYRRESGGSGSG